MAQEVVVEFGKDVVKVNLHGATLVSWTSGGEELIFVRFDRLAALTIQFSGRFRQRKGDSWWHTNCVSSFWPMGTRS